MHKNSEGCHDPTAGTAYSAIRKERGGRENRPQEKAAICPAPLRGTIMSLHNNEGGSIVNGKIGKKFPLALLTHIADLQASRLDEADGGFDG